MNMSAGIFHESFCTAMARHHASIGVMTTAAVDKDFHLARADCFADCKHLPPSQMRAMLFLSDRFPGFCSIRGKMVAALRERSPDSTPAGVIIL
jgi:hypothetical protein